MHHKWALGLYSHSSDGTEQVIAYASNSLSKSQRRYSTPQCEMYAVVFFTRYFRHYLLEAQFTLRTDHQSLLWLDSYKDTEGVLARWLEKLASFDYTVQHFPGKSHGNADALSRLPETQAKSYSKEVTFSVTTDPNSEPQETSGEQSEDDGVVSNDQKPTDMC